MNGDDLARALDAAPGSDPELDRRIHAAWGSGSSEVPPYTGSVDACLELIGCVLPDWHWHVGWGATGVLPYAMLTRDGSECHCEGPTVPLALLKALVRATDRIGEVR